MSSLTARQRQLQATLHQFYQNPVAQVSLELLLTVITVAFFALFAIRPTLLTMVELVQELEDKQTLNQQLIRKISALNTAQSLLVRYETELGILDAAFPNQPQVLSALRTFEFTASQNQIAIIRLSTDTLPTELPTQITADSSIDTIAFNLTVEGEYDNIRSFITQLSQYQRLFYINSISFSANDTQNVRSLEANIVIETPYFAS